MANYFYSVWTLIFFIVWLIFFLYRRNTRREMLFISIIFGFGGLGSELTHVVDWWQPITLTHTRIGFEDFIIGFCIGGVASVIYESVYNRRLSQKSSLALSPKNPWVFLIAFPLVYLVLFYQLGINSFYSVVVTYLVFIAFMLINRKDLIKDSLLSGLLMLCIGIFIYFVLFILYPNYIREFWYLPRRWYSDLIFGIPAGEYVWYFLTGAYIGPLYEFIKRRKILDL